MSLVYCDADWSAIQWGGRWVLPVYNDNFKLIANVYHDVQLPNKYWGGESVGPMWWRGLYGANHLCGTVSVHVLQYMVVRLQMSGMAGSQKGAWRGVMVLMDEMQL